MDDELAPIDVTEPAAPLPVARLPPYNGYGSQVGPALVILLRMPSNRGHHEGILQPSVVHSAAAGHGCSSSSAQLCSCLHDS